MADDLSETFIQQLDIERRKVDVATHNFSVRELVRMMGEDELNVAPSYQRLFRWDESSESLFIESVFLGLPIPPIFVATNVGFQWEVVDGLQRLSTLAHFLAKDPEGASRVGRKSPLVLEGLEKLSQLNGIGYSSLPRDLQVYFGRQPLHVISLTDKSDLAVRFDVFERLNRGGITLSAQEVRACVYRGRFNDFIEELAKYPNLRTLLKLQKGKQSDGTITEQVLKFFAYKNYRTSYDGRVENFLNKSMEKAQSQFDYTTEERLFKDSVDNLHSICGGPFLRGDSGKGTTPLVFFEACLVGIAEILASGSEIVTPPADWREDESIRTASTAGSNTLPKLNARIGRAREIFSGQS